MMDVNIESNEKISYLPKTFTIGCHTFTVTLYKELYDDEGDPIYGQFDYEELSIRIRVHKDNGELLPRDVVYNTWYHELFHTFNYLWNSGTDESLASTFAMLMCEYNKTKSYAKEESNSTTSSSRKKA